MHFYVFKIYTLLIKKNFFTFKGEMPFEADTIAQLKPLILNSDVIMPSNLSRDCKQVIDWMLRKSADERASLDDIVTSEWMLSADLPNDDVFYKFEENL